MINRNGWGYSYSIVRGEILGFMEDELLRKHLPRMFSLIKNESSLNHKLCRLGIGGRYSQDPVSTFREIKVFGFRGEYGRKAET